MKSPELMSNKYISNLLRNIASAYLLKNENRFKIIAYENAATTVEHLNRELKDIWQEGKLAEVPTFGAALRSHLDEYFKTGKSTHFESILKDIPSSVFVLMKVPGIGPKKAYRLVTEFHLTNPDTVLADVKGKGVEDKIAQLDGFGKKSQQDILESIDQFDTHKDLRERMPLPYAHGMAMHIIEYLKKHKGIEQVDALGSMRRMVPTIGDIDLSVVADDTYADEIIEYFTKYPGKIAIDNAGDRKASIIVSPHIRVDLRIQDKASYGSMLQYFTGSKSHNIKLREFAIKKGYSLNEYGIKPVDHDKTKIKDERTRDGLQLFSDEKSFYNFLGLEYIPPEIREGTNEIETALKKEIPKLITVKDIKGDFHLHSSYDLKPSHDYGANTYVEIAQKAEQLGYSYVGFADHNPKFTDLSEKEIVEIMKKRKSDIETMFTKSKMNLSYFIGLEADILPDGRVALPEAAVDYVDFLIVSVHSSFGMDIEKMTERVLKALSFPKVKILGHPTGRLLGKREGYELKWQEIFEYTVKKHIAIEINSWPERLDLPDTLVREGKRYGVKYFINTDAHANEQMDNMLYGVSVARRGWLKKEDVINTSTLTQLKDWL